MASEWIPFVWVERGATDCSREWFPARGAWMPSHDTRHDSCEIYIHRDAARAWQAFRDWLDGTPEQWQRRMVMHGRASFAEGAAINPLMAEMYERMGGAR